MKIIKNTQQEGNGFFEHLSAVWQPATSDCVSLIFINDIAFKNNIESVTYVCANIAIMVNECGLNSFEMTIHVTRNSFSKITFIEGFCYDSIES